MLQSIADSSIRWGGSFSMPMQDGLAMCIG